MNQPKQYPFSRTGEEGKVNCRIHLGIVVTLLLAVWQEYWVQPEWAIHILSQQYQLAGLGMTTLLLIAACVAKHSRETIIRYLLVVAAAFAGVAIAMQVIIINHWSVFLAVLTVISPIYIVGVPSIKSAFSTWTNFSIFVFVAGALVVGGIAISAHTNFLLALAVLLPESWVEYLMLGIVGFLLLGFMLLLFGGYLAVMVVNAREMSESANFPNRPRKRRR